MKWTMHVSASRAFEIFIAAVGVFLLLAFISALADPLHRPVYIDELIYSGQYFLELRVRPHRFFWTVGSKQPLLFWLHSLAYRFTPEALNGLPHFGLVMTRVLSAGLILGVPIVLMFLNFPRKNRWVYGCASLLICFLSPFMVIHSRLAIVEPLLLFTAALSLVSFYRYLLHPSAFSLAASALCNFLLAMTKTSGLFVFCGAAAGCIIALGMDRVRRQIYLPMIALQSVSFLGAYGFVRWNHELQQESNKMLDFRQFHASTLWDRVGYYLSLGSYFFPYFLVVVFVFGGSFVLRRELKKNRASAVFMLSLLCISLVSSVVTLFGMGERLLSRYLVFTYFPWMAAGYLVFSWTLDAIGNQRISKRILLFFSAFVILIGVDLYSVLPIFRDFIGESPRIAKLDKEHYFGKYTVESLAGLDSIILDKNAEIYALAPPYMEKMMAFVMLGKHEGWKRVRTLPSIASINNIQCSSDFDSTLFFVANWADQHEIKNRETDFTTLREYSILQTGHTISLVSKRCPSQANQLISKTQ